jgi:hypothetical protein
MKVLLYSRWASHDFVDDIVYEGLRGTIGDGNIFVYVPRDGAAPQYMDNPGNGVPKANYIHADDIIDRIDKFDALLMFSSSVINPDFSSVLNKKTGSTKIFIDGADDFFVRCVYKHPEISHYLKRELYDHISIRMKSEWTIRYLYEQPKISKILNSKRWYSKWNLPIGVSVSKNFNKLKPFPLTVPKPSMPMRKGRRKNQFMFVGTYNNPERRKYAEAASSILARANMKNYYIGERKFPKEDYFDMLRNCKIGLSLRGTGYDTIRYWEIPAYGAALLSQRLPLCLPHNFVDEESALYFDNADELERKIDRYLIKTNEWMTIAREGHRNYLKYHTPEKRVKELILDVCKG